jgi:hypothetical protein
MTDANRYASCDGRPLIIEWRITGHIFATFEIDAQEAERVLPDALQLVEIRPGIAVLSVGALRYAPGHFGEGSPAFEELVGALHVSPDLSVDMPVPTMSFYSFTVLSDSIDFVRQEGTTLFTPTVHDPSLTLGFTENRLGMDVRNDEGPILSVVNDDFVPRFEPKEMWGQHYTDTRGLQHGIWEWDGSRAEHQRRDRNWTLHPHSFWAGLDVSRVRRSYRQMMLEPGTTCIERFYEMKPLEP